MMSCIPTGFGPRQGSQRIGNSWIGIEAQPSPAWGQSKVSTYSILSTSLFRSNVQLSQSGVLLAVSHLACSLFISPVIHGRISQPECSALCNTANTLLLTSPCCSRHGRCYWYLDGTRESRPRRPPDSRLSRNSWLSSQPTFEGEATAEQ